MNESLPFEMSSEIASVLKLGREQLLSERKNQTHWDFCANLGSHFLSQYYLLLAWLDIDDSKIAPLHLKELLLSTQLPDGSWHQTKDPLIASGDFNATIFNYWALKAMGTDLQAPVMTKAREFILKNGGIAESALFSKTFLALFGNYPWTGLTYVPYVVFIDGMPSNYKSFSQWVIPHLMPIAYLRHIRVCRDLGANFSVQELWVGPPPVIEADERKPNLLHEGLLVEKILRSQQPRGSWGGYTVATLLTLATLDHFKKHSKYGHARIKTAFQKGFGFLEWLYLTPGPGAYMGALMDGHYWDTLLVANGLYEAGCDLETLQPTASYIANTQVEAGGFPYGLDFEYAPDVDDTAEAILLLSHWEKYESRIERAALWLRKMQNRDGGWGAFDRGNEGNLLLRVITTKYNDSVSLFDNSSADSTGHVLDALATAGLNKSNCPESGFGIEFLKRKQNRSGAWIGRWAVNYLFGTTCAVVGLIRAGESPNEKYIARAYTWLMSKQNPDGGFGESTLSYTDPKQAGCGVSTPSQTAWVLWALSFSPKHIHSECASRAAQYLVDDFKANGQWVDSSVTGTGHPGILYMNYPSYARAFPMIALGLYLKGLRGLPKT
jgi:squalene-hopene/tetraprenyl-beta-curcumene cyclase